MQHIPGPKNIADSLSRLTQKGAKLESGRNVAEEYVRFVAQTAAPHTVPIKELEQESAEDEELTDVRQRIQANDWNDGPSGMKAVRMELTIPGKVVLRGTRIVVPRKLRRRIMELAHEGHQGIVKTKVRLRSKVWWPGLDKDVENLCRRCHDCQVLGMPSPPEPVKPTELPTEPWVDVAADLMGPIPTGKYFFVIVDYFSRYVETKIMKWVTSKKIIAALQEIFSRNGIPCSLRTDNGPQFVSQEFEDYMRELGIEHRRTAPLWPQVNGEVERQNRHLIKAMKIANSK